MPMQLSDLNADRLGYSDISQIVSDTAQRSSQPQAFPSEQDAMATLALPSVNFAPELLPGQPTTKSDRSVPGPNQAPDHDHLHRQ